MKKNIGIVGIILILALVGIAGCGDGNDGGGTSNPEDTVRKSLEAMDNGDIDKSFSYFLIEEEDRESLEEMKSLFEGASIDISNLKTTLISESSDEAVVKVSYDMDMDMDWMEESEKSSEEETINLVKVDGKWLMLMDE
ncbi:MAG: hypothetical protein GY861_13430 [bacterium]|nr:hypothetical protein [bacterium]